MVIAPTRELAAQIGSVAAPFLSAALPATMRHQLLTGGRSVVADVAAVTKEGVNIIVGTPGRIDTILTRCQAQLQLSHFKVREAWRRGVSTTGARERNDDAMMSELTQCSLKGFFHICHLFHQVFSRPGSLIPRSFCSFSR